MTDHLPEGIDDPYHPEAGFVVTVENKPYGIPAQIMDHPDVTLLRIRVWNLIERQTCRADIPDRLGITMDEAEAAIDWIGEVYGIPSGWWQTDDDIPDYLRPPWERKQK